MFQSKAEAHRLALCIWHSYGHWPGGLHKENRSSCCSSQYPCAPLQESLLMGWATAGRNCSDSPQLAPPSPKGPSDKHLHSVTTEEEHPHHITRGCCAWLYEECTSLHGQGRTPPWPSDTAAPVQPCFLCFLSSFYATEQMFPRSNQNAHLD